MKCDCCGKEFENTEHQLTMIMHLKPHKLEFCSFDCMTEYYGLVKKSYRAELIKFIDFVLENELPHGVSWVYATQLKRGIGVIEMVEEKKVSLTDVSEIPKATSYWSPETKKFEPRTIQIKNITITCGQCGKDYDMDEEYADLIRNIDGWFGRCPHCKGINLISFKILKMLTESNEVRRKRFKGMFKQILEDCYKRHGWSD